jgi:phage terminase large subunit
LKTALAEPGNSGEGHEGRLYPRGQKDLAQSSKALDRAKLKEHQLTEADGFKVFRDVIQTPKMA